MRASLALTGLALLVVGLPAPTHAETADECQGKPATIVVTPGTETVDGTPGNDVILVLGRGTSVFGGAGDDTICLREGDGAAFGGSGHDSVEARGSDAPDDLYVQQVEDLDIDLGPGEDILRLRSITDGNGSVDLGDGADRLDVFQLRAIAADLHRGRLVLDGSGRYRLRGVESVYAGARHTTLVGADADERLAAVGTACTIVMRGGGGADRLTVAGDEDGKDYECQRYARRLDGQGGDDVLKGRGHDDTLVGGPGSDAAYGGGGRDHCQAETEKNCEPAAGLSAPTYAASAAPDCQGKPATIVQSEGVVEGTDGDDVIVGGTETKVRAGEGDDTICVAGGRVEGGDGDDTAQMRGTDGADFVELRNVEDVDVDTAGGPDHVRLVFDDRFGGSVGSVDEGDGQDILSVILTRSGTNIFLPRGFIETVGGHTWLGGAENVFASGRWVRIYGNRDDNELSADGCRVALVGGQGADVLRVVDSHWITKDCGVRQQWLRGRGGPDRLYGGRMDDILQGGSGHDRAVGNQGVDRCTAEEERSCER